MTFTTLTQFFLCFLQYIIRNTPDSIEESLCGSSACLFVRAVWWSNGANASSRNTSTCAVVLVVNFDTLWLCHIRLWLVTHPVSRKLHLIWTWWIYQGISWNHLRTYGFGGWWTYGFGGWTYGYGHMVSEKLAYNVCASYWVFAAAQSNLDTINWDH